MPFPRADFYKKSGDRLPIFEYTCQNANGTAYDLTGGSAKLVVRRRATGKVTEFTMVISNASLGVVQYAWGSGDLNTPGWYDAEVETTVSSKDATFPNSGQLSLLVTDDNN